MTGFFSSHLRFTSLAPEPTGLTSFLQEYVMDSPAMLSGAWTFPNSGNTIGLHLRQSHGGNGALSKLSYNHYFLPSKSDDLLAEVPTGRAHCSLDAEGPT